MLLSLNLMLVLQYYVKNTHIFLQTTLTVLLFDKKTHLWKAVHGLVRLF